MARRRCFVLTWEKCLHPHLGISRARDVFPFQVAVFTTAISVVYLRFAPRQEPEEADGADDDGDGDGDGTIESLGEPSPETLQALAAMGISPKRGSAAGKASIGGGSDVTSPSSRTTPRPRRPTEMTIQA